MKILGLILLAILVGLCFGVGINNVAFDNQSKRNRKRDIKKYGPKY